MKNTTLRMKWAFYTEGLPLDGRPLEEQSLGGSESALWQMARELAKRGHEVDVFANCPNPGVYGQVRYHDRRDFPPRALALEWDVFVAHRFFSVLPHVERAAMRWLWLHDMPVAAKQMAALMFGTEQAMVLSDFHRDAYLKAEPKLEPALWTTRNGVDLDMVEKFTAGAERNKKLFVYASRPERGLARLLTEVWPRLHAADPGRQLVVTSYDMSQYPLDPQLRAHNQALDRLMSETPGVVNAVALPKKAFYRLLAQAGAVLYPTEFPEISCIVALEAQACGAPIIATTDFALPETIAYGRELGLEKPKSKDYVERFVAKVEQVMGDDLLWKRLQKEGRAHVRAKYSWAQIASEWESRAMELFERRAWEKPERVYDQLVHDSDLVAAREFARREQDENGADPEHWSRKAVTWLDSLLATHHEEPDAYSEGAGEQVNQGWDTNGRFGKIVSLIPKGAKRVLDVGAGAGGLAARIHKDRPDLKVTAVDFSPALVARAGAFFAKAFPGDESAPIALCGDATKGAGAVASDELFDVVISSEVIEHQVDTQAFVASLEKLCRKGGTVILTAPSGPWESMSFVKAAAQSQNDWEKNRFHVHHFTGRDLEELFGRKHDFDLQFTAGGRTARGEIIGWWFVSWKKSEAATGTVDYRRKFLTTRPYQRLAHCMIVRNEEDSLNQHLKSIYAVVDEIHVTDTGSTDRTKEIVREWQARGAHSPKIFLHEATWEEVRPLPGPERIGGAPYDKNEEQADRYIEANRLIDFSRARNLSVAPAIARGVDWVLWADADEVFRGAQGLRKYLSTRLSPALVINQRHMTLDPEDDPGVDTPFRVFKTGIGIQFYGVVHEQPSFGVNDLCSAALALSDVEVVHFGYLDKATIRQKCVARNMTLVGKDRYVYPERLLGKMNVLRDSVHLAQFELEATGGKMTEKAVRYLRSAAAIYLSDFTDPKNPYYPHARKFYQRALMILAAGNAPLEDGGPLPIQAQVQLVVAPGGIPQKAELPPAERWWFGTKEELAEKVSGELEKLFAQIGEAA